MFEDKSTRRFFVRQPSSLKVQVRTFQAVGVETIEESRLRDFSRGGARIMLKHRVEFGEAVELTFAMPRLLRVYDQNETDYKIWAIVRYVDELPGDEPEQKIFQIGAAFIGASPPRGFLVDPARRYDIKPTPNRDGIWFVR